MRKVKRLEIQVEFLYQALELQSQWLIDALNRIEKLESDKEINDIDSGKWYKKS
jgi:hypothetical protein